MSEGYPYESDLQVIRSYVWGGGEIPILLSFNLHLMLSIKLNILYNTKFEDENIN